MPGPLLLVYFMVSANSVFLRTLFRFTIMQQQLKIIWLRIYHKSGSVIVMLCENHCYIFLKIPCWRSFDRWRVSLLTARQAPSQLTVMLHMYIVQLGYCLIVLYVLCVANPVTASVYPGLNTSLWHQELVALHCTHKLHGCCQESFQLFNRGSWSYEAFFLNFYGPQESTPPAWRAGTTALFLTGSKHP